MITSAEAGSRRWIIPFLYMALATGGCDARLDLRVNQEDAPRGSMASGKRLLDEGRAVEAVTAFRHHIRQAGADLMSLNGLAIAYAELGRSDLAAEMFSRALALAPDDPATLNNIGFSALRRADAELARHYLEKARGQIGDLGEIEGNLARLALLEAIERQPALQQAILGKQAMPAHADGPSASIRHVSLPTTPRRTAVASPKSGKPEPSTDSLIDFTSVIDPYSQGRTIE